MTVEETITLHELNTRIGRVIMMSRGTQSVWVTAELSDVSTKGGHTYMELIQKDDRGTQIAKARAMIWRSSAEEIYRFEQSTGQRFCSGIKLKVLASATMHPLFGLSLTITKIDPTFTMGDLLVRRREILEKLKADGVLESNKNLSWRLPSLRVAIISAPEAAGYGDFMNHIVTSGLRYRFKTSLFQAVMQGERTVTTVLEALDRIECDTTDWDCVVIIRGGGATSDLAAFENYELAHRIAAYHIPVIVGIGHERDVTVLDYVANVRVKTPTAAAEFLIRKWDELMEQLTKSSQCLRDIVKEKVSSETVRLSYYKSNIYNFALMAVGRGKHRIERGVLMLEAINTRRILPSRQHLGTFPAQLKLILGNVLEKKSSALKGYSLLLEALSPESVLKRGYSITRIAGKTVTSAKIDVPAGTEIVTVLSDGEIISIKR